MDNASFEKRKKVINDLIHDKMYVPMKAKEIAILLGISKEDRPALMEVLDALVLEGKIGVSKKGKYGKAENTAIVGTFESTQKGFGFVVIEDEPGQDIYVAEKDINGALHNDKVQVVITSEAKDGRRREGRIIKVIERGTLNIVGTYEKDGKYGFVIPDNLRFARDIYIASGHNKGAVTGHKVVVKLTSYGDDKHNPEGDVIDIIGHVDDPGTDIMSIVLGYDIPTEFPQEVFDSLNDIPDSVAAEDIEGRKDCRDWQTVTIDGEDAKDLDDAVTLTKDGDNYRLGVHIADVSNYVTEHSLLDKEALERGTSVYLVDRVIPMLPHKLSNGICSLNQGVDRLALSCIMAIDAKGNVIDHEICETVINVDRRMSYTQVQKLIDGSDKDLSDEYRDFIPMFLMMDELALILRKKRHSRGSIDFDFDESKIKIDSDGKVVSIGVYERRRSNEIIEDFMLAANETIAEDYFWQDIPFEYRVHETPDADRVEQLALLISNFGMYFKASKENIHPKEFQKLLDRIKGEPYENLVSRMALRTMKQAKYSTECTGHFGLSCKYYCHFTSPIRRYPDLQIHRIIKENIHGRLDSRRIEHYSMILDRVADDNSRKERRAEEAERDVEKLKKVEYMSAHIGEVYDGFVSGVTNRGMFVELPNTVEGFVNVADMRDDYYYFSQEDYAMIGEDTGKQYAIGDPIQIKVKNTDKMTKSIDFSIVYKGEDTFVKGKRKHSHRK